MSINISTSEQKYLIYIVTSISIIGRKRKIYNNHSKEYLHQIGKHLHSLIFQHLHSTLLNGINQDKVNRCTVVWSASEVNWNILESCSVLSIRISQDIDDKLLNLDL